MSWDEAGVKLTRRQRRRDTRVALCGAENVSSRCQESRAVVLTARARAATRERVEKEKNVPAMQPLRRVCHRSNDETVCRRRRRGLRSETRAQSRVVVSLWVLVSDLSPHWTRHYLGGTILGEARSQCRRMCHRAIEAARIGEGRRRRP